VQYAANTGAGLPATLPIEGALQLIHRTHVEHDARIAMSNAVHQAEIVVIGRGDSELASRIAHHIGQCGGNLAAAIGPDTRFAVRSPNATAADVDAARSHGVAVIDEAEFERIVDIHTAHRNKQQVKAAARRAVDENRVASLTAQPETTTPSSSARPHGMATAKDDPKRRATRPPAISEREQELERHARNVRSLNTSSPLRSQLQPLAQPNPPAPDRSDPAPG
jgi:hypothetical protein